MLDIFDKLFELETIIKNNKKEIDELRNEIENNKNEIKELKEYTNKVIGKKEPLDISIIEIKNELKAIGIEESAISIKENGFSILSTKNFSFEISYRNLSNWWHLEKYRRSHEISFYIPNYIPYKYDEKKSLTMYFHNNKKDMYQEIKNIIKYC